jgi:crotonobetainyl-CoA:carnitine CoA-transferase CaiB-like acyl-CoA transferase
MSAHPSVIPFGFFRTADGYLALACAKDKFFRALAEAIDLPALAEDPRFETFETRRQHRAELTLLLNDRLATESTATWLARLERIVPVAPIRSMEEALDIHELLERDMLAEFQHPTFGTVRSVGLPMRVGDFTPVYSAGPRLGEHVDLLLKDLGYEPDEIKGLRAAGAFGDPKDSEGTPP